MYCSGLRGSFCPGGGKCGGNDADAAAHQGPAAPAHTHPQEQASAHTLCPAAVSTAGAAAPVSGMQLHSRLMQSSVAVAWELAGQRAGPSCHHCQQRC